MKLCCTCKLEKPDVAFHRKADARDGLYPTCKVCRKVQQVAYRAANSERLLQYDRTRNSAPHRLALKRKQYGKNKTARLRYFAQYAKDKPDVVRRAKQAYKVRNPHLVLAATRKRQARKLSAMPSWANEFFIAEAYDLARRRTKMLGFKWHVDHTVPLLNKQVCGLHCEANLQVIPATSNLAKGNRTWPDMAL